MNYTVIIESILVVDNLSFLKLDINLKMVEDNAKVILEKIKNINLTSKDEERVEYFIKLWMNSFAIKKELAEAQLDFFLNGDKKVIPQGIIKLIFFYNYVIFPNELEKYKFCGCGLNIPDVPLPERKVNNFQTVKLGEKILSEGVKRYVIPQELNIFFLEKIGKKHPYYDFFRRNVNKYFIIEIDDFDSLI